MVDSAQQCSVLQVISGDIDGIIHRHCCVGLECLFFSCYVGRGIKCLRFSQRAVYNYYFIHIFTETKRKAAKVCETAEPVS